MAHMKKPKALSPEEAYRRLRKHPHWVVERGRTYRDFRFDTFRAALGFVVAVGAIAEKLGHHPNIQMHEYHFVRLESYTHLMGGLTDRDIAFIKAIDRFLAQR